MIGWLDDRRLGTVAKGCCCREKERQGTKMASCMRVLQRMLGRCFMTNLGFHGSFRIAGSVGERCSSSFSVLFLSNCNFGSFCFLICWMTAENTDPDRTDYWGGDYGNLSIATMYKYCLKFCNKSEHTG